MADMAAALNSAEVELKVVAQRLQDALHTTSRSLIAAAGRVGKWRGGHPADDGYVVNDLGEVQGMGATIDTLCVRFVACRKHYLRLLDIADA